MNSREKWVILMWKKHEEGLTKREARNLEKLTKRLNELDQVALEYYLSIKKTQDEIIKSKDIDYKYPDPNRNPRPGSQKTDGSTGTWPIKKEATNEV